LLVDHFPKKVILIYRPIVAVRLRPISKLIRGSNERLVAARFGHGAMSVLSPL
jgi:hypothetical protein